jgi:hypothetical protein
MQETDSPVFPSLRRGISPWCLLVCFAVMCTHFPPMDAKDTEKSSSFHGESFALRISCARNPKLFEALTQFQCVCVDAVSTSLLQLATTEAFIRRPANTSQTLSPTLKHSFGALSSFWAATSKRSGAGFAACTSSAVTIGQSS